MNFQIKNRFTAAVIFECELSEEASEQSHRSQLGFAVKKAWTAKTDLRDADLCYADLRGADLCDADLRDADLRYDDLRGANLCDADLRYADLRGADLGDADLRGADLRGADLCGANLRGADLCGAENVPESYYALCRDDLWAVLSATPHEVPGLRAALIAGKVDGSTYEGECACLVGTIANVRGCNYGAIEMVKPNSSRPIERFFMQISKGHTPDNSDSAKRAVEWIDQWTTNMQSAFGKEA